MSNKDNIHLGGVTRPENLLPCPFCGGAPGYMARSSGDTEPDEYHAIYCHCDGYSATAHMTAGSQAEVVDRWNRRAAPVLAPDHTGMHVDYSGLLGYAQRSLRRRDPLHSGLIEQLQEHLGELGDRYYSGDLAAVDEFLQLYCIARDSRKTLKEGTPS